MMIRSALPAAQATSVGQRKPEASTEIAEHADEKEKRKTETITLVLNATTRDTPLSSSLLFWTLSSHPTASKLSIMNARRINTPTLTEVQNQLRL